MDGMLSQEEINALLSGMDAGNDDSYNLDSKPHQELTDEEKDAIGEISNISMGTAATTLSTLVNNKVLITTPVVDYATWDEIASNYRRPCVFVQISYREGLDGNNILILDEHDVKVITNLMMGGDGTMLDPELSELHLSAISEAMNQMMGSAATSISSMLEKKVDISPPNADLVDMNGNINLEDMSPFLNETFVKVSFRMEIEGLIDSQLMQLYPFEFARDLYNKFTQHAAYSGPGDSGSSNGGASLASEAQPEQAPVTQSASAPVMPADNGANPMMGAMPNMMYNQPMMGMPMGMPMGVPMGQPAPDVNVSPAQFVPFTNTASPVIQQENIDLIMDVPLEVTVELGRTNKSIKEILDFSPGTIIELNKLAGEPIDVLVNGKYVAKGEVVVIEECFGIRVTDIIK